MKKLFFTSLFICFGLIASAADYTVTSVIYSGNGSAVNYWINNGGDEAETLTEVELEGTVTPTAVNCLQMTRVQNEGSEWHGIGFDLTSLNTNLAAGTQIAMWVKKDLAENVKLELQFSDGSSTILSDLKWVNGDNSWTYLVFDFSEAENQTSTISNLYVQLHTGGSDGETATIQVTGIRKGFNLEEPTEISEETESKMEVYSQGGNLYVSGEATFSVYDISGNVVANFEAGNNVVKLNKGLYIVQSGSEIVKTTVE